MTKTEEKYKIIEVIYSSLNNTVFRASNIEKNETVIIKTLNNEFNDPISISKIKNEYQLLKKLQDEYVVKVHEFLKFENKFSIVTEDFGGIPLSQYIKNNDMEIKEILDIALKITKCIKYIHSNHVIHKNINPFNIMYNPDTKKIKLIGFEISSEFSFETAEALNPNKVEGTVAYISPEQTGRMNRPMDYRTDFYSLGVTLYELACSKLPITSIDPTDVVYFHIAKTPLPVNKVKPSIPSVVSKIILKLMAKMPEERYKSASGIEFDLQECIEQLEKKGIIEEFDLGRRDRSNKFEIPKKLYGRENEIKKLLDAFQNARKGNATLILVGGYSGIGKTSIVNELHKPIMKEHGIFISGKYDQFNKNTPFYALFHAIDQFCNYILSDSDVEIENWKNKMLEVLGTNGRLITEMVPRLELIIGPQQELHEESPVKAQIKFNDALQNLMRVISSQEHPIILFMDDVQWADIASLELFQKILMDHSIKGLILIFTYRENEVDISHPLIRTIEKVKKNNGEIRYVHMNNLDVNAVTQMIYHIVNGSEQAVAEIAKVVYEKTLGNPFYIIEFLKYCNKERLFYYDEIKKIWKWNEREIQNCSIYDNVANFLIKKIKTLPKATKELVSIAACIGNYFDIRVLSVVLGKNIKEIKEELKPAISSEMIYAQGKKALSSKNMEFKFCHDKFRQAAYLILSKENKKKIHLNIAKYYEKIEEIYENSYLFEVAEHYSKALDYIVSIQEIERVIEIFLKAAHAARLTSAFDTARQYLELIMDIAPEILKKNDSFLRPIYIEYHLVLYSLAMFEELDKTYINIEKVSKNPLDLVDACCIQSISLSNRSRYKEAFFLGVGLLEKLGVNYPKDGLRDVLNAEIEKFYMYESSGSIAKLEEKEILHEGKDKAIAKLLNRITAAALFLDPFACCWSTLINTNLMIEKGVTTWALEISPVMMMTLVSLRNDYYTAYTFVKKVIHIAEKKGFYSELYRMYHTYSLFSCHWFKPLETVIYYAHESYKGNLQNGEFEFSCFSFFTSQTAVIECCNSVSEMQAETEAALSFASKKGNLYALESFVNFRQFLKALKRETFIYGSFNDEDFNEEKYMKDINHNSIGLCYYYIYRALSAVLFGDFKTAYTLTEMAVPYLPYVETFYITALYRFLNSISICKTIEEVKNIEQKQTMQKVLEENQQWMYERAKYAPFNFQHLYDVVCAEMKAMEGKYEEALRLYEKSMFEAKKNKRPYHYGLICEITAQRYLKMGIKKTASFYIKEAYASFLTWGAIGKVESMKEKYKDILFSSSDFQSLLSVNNDLSSIDLKAIAKVAQTISSEIERKKLLEKLMKIIMQNSGSTMGHILLKDESSWILSISGGLNNELEMKFDHKEINFDSTDIKKILPISMISYVMRTKEVIIIEDIEQSQFSSDNYFSGNSIKSSICFPILKQNILIGIVYLENNELSGAFTKENFEVLKIISIQAAISIENAFLYTKLENKVKVRTYQLEETIVKFKETNAALQQEIIQRINTEKALKESERQFRNAVKEAPIPMMLYAEDGEIIKTSRTWTDITGYSIKDIPTTAGWADISQVFKKNEKSTDVSRLYNLKKTQNDGEYTVKTRDGDVRIWDFYSAYIGNLQDGRKMLMRVAIDITKRKCMEESQKSIEEERRRLHEIKEYDRIKTEFFANISHELRTPINVIFSALQMHELRLKDNSFTDSYKYTNIIKQNCYRLLRLVNNLIDITKIDSGYFDINETNHNIISLIEDITLSVADYIENKGLSLIFDTDVEEKIIACDPEKIERIILNLLSNAVKFTSSPGNILVTIEDGIENICIRVKDTGKGIPAEKLNSIFERFIQVDKSLARDHEGSGIGLSLVKCLVELHGGTISVKSKVGYGTEFIIYVPCKLVDESNDDIVCRYATGKSSIQKINIEFSDIYK